MGKEIIACVLFILSIEKVQLVPCFLPVFCTFLTLVLQYIYYSYFKLEAYDISQKGREMSQGLISSPHTESSFVHWKVHSRV